ncbi:hypothetical protein [Lysinibacillus fusiformis]|uniref:hypothetical protein n=1 Tax=Lysinibacillus fusiformis TaxID=28031 RepID=UPI00371D2A8E
MKTKYKQNLHTSVEGLVEQVKLFYEFIDDYNLTEDWRIYENIAKAQKLVEKSRANGQLVEF